MDFMIVYNIILWWILPSVCHILSLLIPGSYVVLIYLRQSCCYCLGCHSFHSDSNWRLVMADDGRQPRPSKSTASVPALLKQFHPHRHATCTDGNNGSYYCWRHYVFIHYLGTVFQVVPAAILQVSEWEQRTSLNSWVVQSCISLGHSLQLTALYRFDC